MFQKRFISNSLAFLFCLLILGCSNPFHRFGNKSETEDKLANIIRKGKIVAILDCNSTDYFVYKGVPMGFQFELLKRFADYLGVRLEVKTSKTVTSAFALLNNNQCDILAKDLGITVQFHTAKLVKF